MITREQFIEATGMEPEHDDLERVNCPKAGQIMHSCCGWDKANNMPQFMVGPRKLAKDACSHCGGDKVLIVNLDGGGTAKKRLHYDWCRYANAE